MHADNNQPIGVFDSGVGGLTVANAIKNMLPYEQMVYFGDTFHLPYGDKSAESVRFYANRIAEFLLSKQCKVILIACNTASAVAFEEVKKNIGDKALVIDVINPVVDYVATHKHIKKVGVIGTKGTINSGSYAQKINSVRPDIVLVSLATPLLVPMIEEGFVFDDISNAIIRSYLSREELKNIDTLILGCTHYPIIKNQIKKFFDFKVSVLDSANIVANVLRDILTDKGMLADVRKPEHIFYVSDYTDYFQSIANVFFEQSLKLNKHNIWT